MGRVKDYLDGVIGQFGMLILAAVLVAYWKTGGNLGSVSFISDAWIRYESALKSPMTGTVIILAAVIGGLRLMAGVIKDAIAAGTKIVLLAAMSLAILHIFSGVDAISFLSQIGGWLGS